MNKNRFPSLLILSFFAILFVCVVYPNHILADDQDILRVHFMDVGYGDAAFIEFSDDNNLLIDSGSASFSKKLIVYLKSIGVTEIDTVIITHPHENHFGAMPQVIQHFPINRVFVNGDQRGDKGYDELLEDFVQRDISVEPLMRGDQLMDLSQGVTLKILHPPHLKSNINDNSIVALLASEQSSIIFFSDVGTKKQDEIIEQFPEIRGAEYIQVPHHGWPVSEKFISTFKDKVFIVSTGENRWGVPDEKGNLDKLTGTVLRTDQQGVVVIEVN